MAHRTGVGEQKYRCSAYCTRSSIIQVPVFSRSRKKPVTFSRATGPNSALMTFRISRIDRDPSAKLRASNW